MVATLKIVSNTCPTQALNGMTYLVKNSLIPSVKEEWNKQCFRQSNFHGSSTDGSFIMAYSNYFLSPSEINKYCLFFQVTNL